MHHRTMDMAFLPLHVKCMIICSTNPSLMTNATSWLHWAPLCVPPTTIAVWSKDTSGDGVMDSVNQSFCLYHVPPCSPQSPLLRFFSVFVFSFRVNGFMINLQVDFGFQTLVDCGFNSSVDSGFQSTGFRIQKFKTLWIPDSGFCYMRQNWDISQSSNVYLH